MMAGVCGPRNNKAANLSTRAGDRPGPLAPDRESSCVGSCKGQPPPIATNLRFTFEIDNSKRPRLEITDWELFVVDAAKNAVSWDAIPIQPADWGGEVPAGKTLVVQLVDGMFPPHLATTGSLRIALRLRSVRGKTLWIASNVFDVQQVSSRGQGVSPPP